MRVVWNSHFRRAFKRLIKKNPELHNKITSVLSLLAKDPLTPSLKSHKLTGKLNDLWFCSVSYDCRIIFIFSQDENSEESLIILVDIGSNDEFY